MSKNETASARIPEGLAFTPARPAFNLAAAVHRHSIASPGALALSHEGRTLCYGQLARQAAGLAAYLKQGPTWPAQGAGQARVGIIASRGADACIAVLGACWAGATYVPISHFMPEERIVSIVSRCGLSAVVADVQGATLLTEKVMQACPGCVLVLGGPGSSPPHASRATWLDPASLEHAEGAAPSPVQATDTAYIIFTSGTTGVPKGVVIPAGAFRHYVHSMRDYLGLRPSDRALEIFELSFDVSAHNMFTTWEAGASLHILPCSRVMNATRFAQEHELTVWTSVPSLVGMLQQAKTLRPGALPRLRVSTFGGEPLPRSVVETWRSAASSSAIHNLYGPTEATVTCLAQRVDQHMPLLAGRDVLAVGQPLAGVQAAVLDADLQAVADGTPGELAIAGVQLATGYLDTPQMTSARFVHVNGQRWYLTGDRAIRDASGNFHCLGRMDNQVKVLGHRVELEEVDAHLRLVADTGLAASVAWPVINGAPHGLVAFVAGTAVEGARIIDALKLRLPHYMVPSRIFPIPELPTNANGKIDRRALLQLLEQG